MPLQIIQADLLQQKVDIIVNAANNQLQMGGGVCGAIFQKANPIKLQQACDAIGYCPTGEAIYTDGFDLCKYIIHTVGPIYQDGNQKEEELLRNCYKNSLLLAEQLQEESIAFPLISSGIYGYPKEQAYHIAVDEIGQYLLKEDSKLNVFLVVYDKINTFHARNILNLVKPKTKTYAFNHEPRFGFYFKSEANAFSNNSDECSCCRENTSQIDVQEILNKKEKCFVEKLFDLIDKKQLSDVEVYKHANSDRKQFSKMRVAMQAYHPSKQTALAYAIATKCSLEECLDLLKSAGYTLSNADDTDLIVKYYIEKEFYNIHSINEVLFSCDCKLLGNVAY